MRKGQGVLLIPFLALLFIAVVISVWVIAVDPRLGSITPQKQLLKGDVYKADIYPNTISQLSFVRSKTPSGMIVSDLMADMYDAYSKKDIVTFEKLGDELNLAKQDYAKTFNDDGKCTAFTLSDINNNVIWPKDATRFLDFPCKVSASVKPTVETSIIVPTRDSSSPLMFTQIAIGEPK